MSAIPATVNVATHLSVLLTDGDTGKFPQAVLRDSAAATIGGSPANLVHRGEGLYTLAFTFTTVDDFDVVYIIYNDAGHTVESGKHGRGNDRFAVRVAVLTANDIRDAILSDSTPFQGADIPAILADTDAIDARLPSDPADESAQQASHSTTQAAIATLDASIPGDVQSGMTAQGYTAARAPNLDNLDDSISNVRSDISDIAAVTRFRTTASKRFEIPASGSRTYKVAVNLEDTNGNPEDPDANTITVAVENETAVDRSANLSAATMVRLSAGRYEVIYTVSSAHATEELRFTFTYDENAVTFVKDMVRDTIDSDAVDFTSTDRTTIGDILNDTTAMNARLPADPADESNQIAEHDATQAAVAAVQSDVDDIQARLPAALVGGRIDADVGNMQTDSVSAAAVSAAAVTKIQAGLPTDAELAAVQLDTTAIRDAAIAAEGAAVAGGSPTEVRTNISEATGTFNGMFILVSNAAGVVARRIDDYNNANGAFVVSEPFPFTPANTDPVTILAAADSRFGAVG